MKYRIKESRTYLNNPIFTVEGKSHWYLPWELITGSKLQSYDNIKDAQSRVNELIISDKQEDSIKRNTKRNTKYHYL
jgi:hypothetical protein